MKKLLVFGDSWPYGSDLDEPEKHCFPALIARQLQCTLLNYSKQSTSQDQAVLKFLQVLEDQKLENKNLVVLFCFTGSSRSMYFINNEDFEIHNTDKNFKDYYARIYSDELGRYTFTRNLLLVQNICKNLNVPVYCVSNWDDIPNNKLIDYSKVYSKTLFQILGIDNLSETSNFFWSALRKNKHLTSTCHPDIEGHQLIAQELAQWINCQ